jgi:hypothetical protein
LERIKSPLSEAFEFAQVSARLAAEPAVLERLTNAVETSNAEAFQAIVDERPPRAVCIQLCHWICFFHCHRFCFCVCPPRSAAYFIKIGQYQYSEVCPPMGTTPKIDSQIGGSGLTSDTRAFYQTLRLNGGYSLQTGAPQMEYRFETIPTNAAGNPTAPNWQPVLAGGAAATIIGYTITPGPIFTPVFASLDAQGWIRVESNRHGTGGSPERACAAVEARRSIGRLAAEGPTPEARDSETAPRQHPPEPTHVRI